MERKDAFREETIYTWGHRQWISNNCLHTSPGEARNLSSRKSARFIANRERRIMAERYPQTLVSLLAHDLQDKRVYLIFKIKEINSNLLSLFYLPIMCLIFGTGKRWSTQRRLHCHFGWGSWLRSVHPCELSSCHQWQAQSLSSYSWAPLSFLLELLLPAPVPTHQFCAQNPQSALLPTQALPRYAVVLHQPQLRSPSSSRCRGSGLPGTSSPTLLAALEMMRCSKRERWGVCDKKTNKQTKPQKKARQGKQNRTLFYYT